MDLKKIEFHIRGILEAIGEDPDREGLKETPMRVARMYEEIFEGIGYTNDAICEMFGKTFEDDLVLKSATSEIVLVKDITVFSTCEHHLALMYNMKAAIAYIPNRKIIGLSKIARVADMVGRRLQLQERIGSDIAHILQSITESEDVAVILEGQHACMTARGIKNPNAVTTTTTLCGRFNTDDMLLSKLMKLYK